MILLCFLLVSVILHALYLRVDCWECVWCMHGRANNNCHYNPDAKQHTVQHVRSHVICWHSYNHASIQYHTVNGCWWVLPISCQSQHSLVNMSGLCSFSYSSPETWHEINAAVKSSATVATFKCQLNFISLVSWLLTETIFRCPPRNCMILLLDISSTLSVTYHDHTGVGLLYKPLA